VGYQIPGIKVETHIPHQLLQNFDRPAASAPDLRRMEMSEIKVEHEPSEERLNELGVSSWAIWTKEVSEFPWQYDAQETCYLLEGDVVVTPDGGEPVEIKKGDLVTFPKDMKCRWNIRKDVRKHYKFE
jgi:uncharacterized cupin superfamily protein